VASAIDRQAQVILADLSEHRELFNLELPRAGGVLGEALLDVAKAGVADCFLTESDPDGTPWDELSPDYEKWKAAHRPNPKGNLWGLMSDPDQIEGERAITDEEASMTYGRSPDAKAEATYFQDPDPGRNQPPRGFYGLTREAIDASNSLLDSHFDRHVKP
jgi:hypothetical protein